MRWLLTILIIDLLLWVSTSVEADDVSGWLQEFLGSSSRGDPDIVHHRSKRSLFNFKSVIHCLQPWSNVLLTYGDYGCYCGYKGLGRPLDDTDKCCYEHDYCYDQAEFEPKTFGETTMGSYFSEYIFQCQGHTVKCDAKQNSIYKQAICECDRKAAECFAANRRSYNSKLYDIDTTKYCGENADFQDLHVETHSLFKLYSCPLDYDQDRCCINKGYNSVYQFCCGDQIRNKPSEGSTIVGCCGGKVFDTRIKMCCYGVLHPNAEHLQCCGTLGQVADRTFQTCIDGKPVAKTSTLPANITITEPNRTDGG
uniref:Phospholipase A2 n=1 Tax=Phallusia mammillata TaxID=59560 RepID=A0A6F9DI70_9ASCI|nr:uncharacterized protein LOC100183993 [Phallusia mammillata]